MTIAFAGILVWSGIEAFQRNGDPVPLAATDELLVNNELGKRPAPRVIIDLPRTHVEVIGGVEPTQTQTPVIDIEPAPTTRQPTAIASSQTQLPSGVKYDRYGKPIMVNGKPWTGEVFDYRPIRPKYTRTMKTTAYSPDHRSCGKWADGITASGKSVWMNGGRLVAADRKIPYGTIMTVPGYNNDKPVQVWDRGGAIKGNRLDLLYPTHNIALQWGVQDLPVVFWEFVETD